MKRSENAGQKDCAQMWFGPDFRGSIKVQAMSWAEQGMYRHLLDLAWENGGIPSDLDDVRDILRLTDEEFARAWKRLGRCFVPHPEDPSRLVNDRQEKERAIRAEIREEKSRSGRRGNEVRWGAASQANRAAVADESQSDRKPVAQPIAKDRPSPSPSPSPSRGPISLRPAGPEVLEPSSCCTSSEQRDERPADSRPAGPGRIRQQREIFEALRATSYAQNARDREAALIEASERLDNAGISPPDLITLAHKAKRRGKKPGGLFAHWIKHTDEALKELSKR
jgi:hypothetical protein